MNIYKGIFSFIILLHIGTAKANLVKAQVKKVIDGDTVWVKYNGQKIKFRFKGIDSPEKGQLFYKKSGLALKKCLGKNVYFIAHSKDIHNRLLGYMYNINGFDCGQMQLKTGMAWYAKPFKYQQAKDIATLYEKIHLKSKSQRIGIFKYKDEIEPWKYRYK